MTLVRLRRPTFKRLFHSVLKASRSISLLRCLEYEQLSDRKIEGRVLDFGGGSISNYSSRLPGWIKSTDDSVYETANIDPATLPTYLLNAGGNIPTESERYDTVIALNTLEHIFEINKALSEINRVLRTGGDFLFIVPFIFRVHAHPDDYTRGTPSFWVRLLEQFGFDDVDIEALVWGPFSTSLNISGNIGPFKRMRFLLNLVLDILYFKFRYPGEQDICKDQTAPIINSPLGYIVTARKSGQPKSAS